MKNSRFLLSAIIFVSILFCGCDVNYFQYGCNVVDNQSSHSFEIWTGTTLQDDELLKLRDVPSQASILPNQVNEWVPMTYENEGVNPVCMEILTFTFVFENGVQHTFEGDFIVNDFRSLDSWSCKREGAVSVNDGATYNTYTYTFTDEDYECIMALYE